VGSAVAERAVRCGGSGVADWWLCGQWWWDPKSS
jgi:hypothetical protein